MTQYRTRTARQHHGHPSPPPGEPGPAHGVYTAHDGMQTSSADAVTDGVSVQSQLEQLSPSHDTVLL
jgi:hypothetical protein